MPWLARAIQGALALTIPVMRDLESPVTGECMVRTIPNSTDAKRIYRKIANKARDLLGDILANQELLRFKLGEPEAFSSLVREIEKATEALSEAADSTDSLPPRWRQKRLRDDRIERATLLSPVYELAYGRKPAVNAYPDSDGGPWPDFYTRIVSLVFDDHDVDDRDGMLKEARRIDALSRVTFAPGQMPEYPL